MSVRRHIDHLLHYEPMMSPEDRGRVRIFFLMLVLGIVLWMWALSSAFAGAVMLPHPHGCPARAFCACGASVKVFGKSVRALWPSSAWLRFPRSAPGHMKVAVRPGHLFVIDYMIDAKTAMAWDYNSGKHRSRYHARSIVGYRIVNPSARMAGVQ